MKHKMILTTAALLPLLLASAADKVQPLNAKLGLWQITSTRKNAGALPIAPETLAVMPPEQRAKAEAFFKQKGAQASPSSTTQTCITADKLAKVPFTNEAGKSCQRTIVASTSKLTEVHEECNDASGAKRIMDGRFELTGDSAMKGTMSVKAVAAGRTMNIDLDLTGKWLSADCGAVK